MENIECGYCSLVFGSVAVVSELAAQHACLKGFKVLAIDNGCVIECPATMVEPEDTKENISPTNECMSPQVAKGWSHDDIKLLISTYKDNKEKFTSPQYNNEQVWAIISAQMEKVGVIKSSAKCDEKWRNLKKSYEKILKLSQSTGESRKEWPYFKELHEILFQNPTINPVFTISSTGKQKSQVGSKPGSSSHCETSEEIENIAPSTSITKPKDIKRKRKNDETLDDVRERRHKEKMEQRERMFNWFQNYFQSHE